MSKVDQLIEKFKEFKEELNKGVNASYSPQPNATTGTSGGEGGMYRSEAVEKAEAGRNAKVMSVSKLIKPTDVTGAGKANTGHEVVEVKTPKNVKSSSGERHPMSKDGSGQDAMAMSEEVVKFDKNGQWKLDKVDPQENVNIPHPQGKAKMANGVNKQENMKDGTNQRIANPSEKSIHDGRGKIHMVKEEGTNEKAGTSHPHNKGKFKVMDEVKEKESKKASPSGLPYNGEDKKMHKADKVLIGTGNNDENTGPGRNSGHGAL